MTAALGATKTSLSILGSFSNMLMIVRCLDTDKRHTKGSLPVRDGVSESHQVMHGSTIIYQVKYKEPQKLHIALFN
jgi:hypothetical protein